MRALLQDPDASLRLPMVNALTDLNLPFACAGVGRTGVLIALWRLIERARNERVIDIFGTVDALRRQRSRMVQTPEQYLSLYEAVSLAIDEDRL
ncbi:hypothetical protein Y032_0001g312 [Ancylostoma ceylanicum]|uniref:Tyrosine specific protein phosphatases domain-containing protein n=1 Tax=Ancylostoma ceylanicum TaxID=53326 RepID=A0A016W5E1_9BILA|nr:hypothetical protein Y032_0001g312 [Ancylostoma ceylanicum]